MAIEAGPAPGDATVGSAHLSGAGRAGAGARRCSTPRFILLRSRWSRARRASARRASCGSCSPGRSSRDRRALVGYCQPLREPFPFGPVIEALRGAAGAPAHRASSAPSQGRCGRSSPSSPRCCRPPSILSGTRGRSGTGPSGRSLELLRALGPTICVLEDLHWSDEGTGDLLRFLVSQLPDELCLVLTYRREDLPPSSASARPDLAAAAGDRPTPGSASRRSARTRYASW